MREMDWEQAYLNGSSPCWYRYKGPNSHWCGRAERWPGHLPGHEHAFVSEMEMLESVYREETAERCPTCGSSRIAPCPNPWHQDTGEDLDEAASVAAICPECHGQHNAELIHRLNELYEAILPLAPDDHPMDSRASRGTQVDFVLEHLAGVVRTRDLLRERLDQFEAYGMDNVAAALDRIKAEREQTSDGTTGRSRKRTLMVSITTLY